MESPRRNGWRRLRLVVTPSWGYLQQNGSFDGMIGMLQRGDIQLGITPAVITKDRLTVADFTVQTWTLRCTIVVNQLPEQAS